MSTKSPWNTHTVLGIFHPRPITAAEMTIVSLLPPSYNVESIAEALSYLENTISLSSAIPITFKQHCCILSTAEIIGSVLRFIADIVDNIKGNRVSVWKIRKR